MSPERSGALGWIGLTALTVLFGMQSLRALLPLWVFMLRDRFSWPTAAVGAAMLALLAIGFLATPISRALGARRHLGLTVGGLALARVALQFWTGDALGDLVLAALASALFWLALPVLATDASASKDGQCGSFLLGFGLGLLGDTSLFGVYGTWDLSWHADPVSLGLILGLAASIFWCFRNARPSNVGSEAATSGIWAALSFVLLLELLILSNLARLAALTDWSIELATLWAIAGRLLALLWVVVLAARGFTDWRPVAGLAVALMAVLWTAWPTGAAAAAQFWAAQVLLAMLGAIAVTIASASGDKRRWATGYGLGLLALGALLFVYYGGFDLQLPFSRDLVPLFAALMVGGWATLAVFRAPSPVSVRFPTDRSWLVAAAILALLPLTQLVGAREAESVARSGGPLKVMTYNVHMGLEPGGHLALEDLARTIEAQDPDVVGLQEVSRGWAITGSVDVLSWLARRLDMSYVFAGATDPLWGNAILSRRPILSSQAVDLPPEDLLIQRGFLSARIGLVPEADGDNFADDDLADDAVEFIVTHFHHRRGDGSIREQQSRALLEAWQGRRQTVIVGDFNGRPGTPEIEAFRNVGLQDVLDLAGVQPGYTYSATHPRRRIDYIWISPDLAVSEAAVPQSLASDHLPVVASVYVREKDGDYSSVKRRTED